MAENPLAPPQTVIIPRPIMLQPRLTVQLPDVPHDSFVKLNYGSRAMPCYFSTRNQNTAPAQPYPSGLMPKDGEKLRWKEIMFDLMAYI